MKFSEKIMKLRRQKGLSQEEFANKLNVSRQAIYKWETEQSVPDIKNVQEICKIFNVSIEYLLNDDLDEEIIKENPNKIKKNMIKIVLKIIVCLLIFYLLIVIIKFCLLSRIMWKSSKCESINTGKREGKIVTYDNLIHESLQSDTMTAYFINNKWLRFFNNNQSINYYDSENNIKYSLELNDKNKYTYIDERLDNLNSNYNIEEQCKESNLMPENIFEMLELSANPLSFITANKIYNNSIDTHEYTFHQFNEDTWQLEILETKNTYDNITYYSRDTFDYWNESNEEEFFKIACENNNINYNMIKSYIEKQKQF